MTNSDRKPVLLVFTLGPGRERARRNLLPRPLRDRELLLHQEGLASTLQAGRICGCELQLAVPQRLSLPEGVRQIKQRGDTFGERLRNAIRCVRERCPGSPLVVVGTDAPDLAADHLQRALEGLAEDPDRVVVGPSLDGGLYLLATAGPVDHELSQVHWCRKNTLRTLLRTLRSRGRRILLLEPLRDLDRREDLERWLAEPGGGSTPWVPLRRLLRRLMAVLRRPPTPVVLGTCRPAFASISLGRDPPR